jgi:hypothetical protein
MNQYLRNNRRIPFQIRRRGPLKLKPL